MCYMPTPSPDLLAFHLTGRTIHYIGMQMQSHDIDVVPRDIWLLRQAHEALPLYSVWATHRPYKSTSSCSQSRHQGNIDTLEWLFKGIGNREHVSSKRYLPQITILCPQLEKRSYHKGNKLCSVQLFFVQKPVHSRLQSKFLQEKWKFCWVLNPELLYNVVHESSKGLPNLFFCWFKQRQVTFSCWYTVRFSAPHQLILS